MVLRAVAHYEGRAVNTFNTLRLGIVNRAFSLHTTYFTLGVRRRARGVRLGERSQLLAHVAPLLVVLELVALAHLVDGGDGVERHLILAQVERLQRAVLLEALAQQAARLLAQQVAREVEVAQRRRGGDDLARRRRRVELQCVAREVELRERRVLQQALEEELAALVAQPVEPEVEVLQRAAKMEKRA